MSILTFFTQHFFKLWLAVNDIKKKLQRSFISSSKKINYNKLPIELFFYKLLLIIVTSKLIRLRRRSAQEMRLNVSITLTSNQARKDITFSSCGATVMQDNFNLNTSNILGSLPRRVKLKKNYFCEIVNVRV